MYSIKITNSKKPKEFGFIKILDVYHDNFKQKGVDRSMLFSSVTYQLGYATCFQTKELAKSVFLLVENTLNDRLMMFCAADAKLSVVKAYSKKKKRQ